MKPTHLTGRLLTLCACLSACSMHASAALQTSLSDMDCVVEPSRIIELGSAVAGLLAETHYDRSDYVEQGALMARLESEVEQVALSIAEITAISNTAIELREMTARFGERTLARNRKLLSSDGISEQGMDEVKTEARVASLQLKQEKERQLMAQLEVQRSRAVFKRREIRSPIDGFVTQRYKHAGEYVDREPVFQMVQLHPLHVEVIVPIEYYGSLSVGRAAEVYLYVPGFENRVIQAVVERVDAVADAASATYGVRLRVDNPDLSIPGGVRCSVDFMPMVSVDVSEAR